jgi:hypothetical protein
MGELEKLREAVSMISEISRSAMKGEGTASEYAETDQQGVCTPKALPTSLQVRAAQTASDINPANAPLLGFAAAGDEALAAVVSDPLRIAVLTTKYWGPSRRRLTVSFLEPTATDLRTRIIAHLNAWACGVQFVHTTGTGQVRISRQQEGYWSYLGTDVLHIAPNRPTMNLQGFTMNTPEREFKRVIRHEAGHTLGFPHEHMRRDLVARIDREKAYEYFARTQGWNRTMVDQQVLTPLDERSLMGTSADQTSIMCYQLPGAITRDGRPIVGGLDINATDRTFATRIYPLAPAAVQERRLELEPYEGEFQEDSEFVAEPALAE